jgi:type V secretory pathway adhesin AidA
MHIKLFCFTLMVIPITSAYADIIIGPGAVNGPIFVTTQNTSIVGSTTVTSTGANFGANVTGFLLTLDSLLTPSPGSILIRTLNGNALNANGGNISASNNVTLLTQNGHAVLANSSSSTVNLSGTFIQTTGSGAGIGAIGGIVNATGVTINNLGNSTPTISAGHGAIAESGGKVILNSGTSIATGAFNAVGFGASGVNSQVTATANIPLVMNGMGALGVYLHDGGQVILLNNSVLQMNASNSVGVSADNTAVALGTIGSGLTINFNATPAAGQAAGTGVVSFNAGNISLESLTVQGAGAGAGAWARLGSTINLSGDSLININADANPTYYTLQTAYLITGNGAIGSIFGVTFGLPIGGLLSNGGTINSTGTTINVTSINGVGAYAAFNSAESFINMSNNTIHTTGDSSFGIEAGENGRITGSNTTVTSSGGGAALFVLAFDSGYGSIALTDSNVQAQGAYTAGLASLNLSSAFTTQASLTNSYLTSEDDTVILGVGGPLSVTSINSTLVAQNGLLIDAQFNASAPQQTVVNLSAAHSQLSGNAHADSQSKVNINLSDNSFWSGASLDATNISLDSSSTWSVTANSTVTQDIHNSGLISYTPPTGSFKTVTTKNYIGSGGMINLNTYLGDDSSPSDLLIINAGSATGTTGLSVQNAGGLGALTLGNGILVVQGINGGTTAPGAFYLSTPVVAGPFEYSLYRSSRDGSSAENWYLRSLCPPGDPNCSPEPPPPGPVPPSPTPPNYRSEIGLYPVLPAMTLLYGQALVDTLHQRVGQGKWPEAQVTPNDSAKRIWGRVVGLHGERDRITSRRFFRSSDYDYNFGFMQIGGDLFKREKENGRRDHVGIFGAFGRGTGNVQRPGLFLGSNQFSALSIGGYWTLYSAKEAYIDTVLQGTRYYDVASKSYRFNPLKTDGWGLVASVEGGYPFIIKPNWIFEPQIQGVYETVDLNNGRDVGGNIQFNDVESVVGRLGVRLAHRRLINEGEKILTTWFRPNFWYQFKGNSNAAFSSIYGPIPFQSQLEGSTLELNLGTTLDLPRNLSLYANGSYGVGLNMHMITYDGRLGIKVKLV